MTEHLELSIDELLLDVDNPRLGSTSSQSEALASIVRLNPEHFQNLMASIKNDGLDPGDSLYVVRSEDGQRRLPGSRKPTTPGEIVQRDTLTVSPHPDRPAIKRFTAHDPVTKWIRAQAWRRATAHNARRFLDKLQADMPFPIGNCFLLKAELGLSLKREYAGSFEPD